MSSQLRSAAGAVILLFSCDWSWAQSNEPFGGPANKARLRRVDSPDGCAEARRA